MKTRLQNNFTTPKQSKRLIELGVPINSADMGIIDDILNFGIEILVEPYDKWCKGYESISMPCWSVGRLIEIYSLATGVEYTKIGISEISLTDLMIKIIEVAVKAKTFDFSKLEEYL